MLGEIAVLGEECGEKAEKLMHAQIVTSTLGSLKL
jgi:hypothetical protein